MRECVCEIPKETGRNRPGYCRICGGKIDARYLSTDSTFAAFFNQLAQLPGVDRHFINQCRDRELAGRDEFGNEYLQRVNELEGIEEACDLALYSHLAVLRARREGRKENVDIALEAAHHAALARNALVRLLHG